MTKQYKTKVTYWLFILVGITTCITPIMQFSTKNIKASLPPLLLALFVCCLLALLIYNIRYVIDNNTLKIYYGIPFLSMQIDISQITSIKKTKSVLAAPAASLDRIAINYGGFNPIVISPKDTQSFVKDLLKINPNIKTSLV
ncbi:PH domain-containing protein [Myroides sp. LJL116]